MEFTGNSLAQRMVRLATARSAPGEREATRTAALSAFDRAIEHFSHGQWLKAFEALAPLADAGDREAARIALLMTTRGPRLFGQAFPAPPSQRQRWQVVASCAYAPEPRREGPSGKGGTPCC